MFLRVINVEQHPICIRNYCGGVYDVEGAKATFVMGNNNYGAIEFRGTRLNVWPIVMNCIIIVGLAVIMFLMVFSVILKNSLCDSTIYLLIYYYCSIILLFSLAWSARVYYNIACIWRLDSLNLSNLSSSDCILIEWLFLAVAKEEALMTK